MCLHSWKKIALGNGKLNKRLISKETFKQYGFDDDNEDIVDAFCIGMAFINLICKSPSTLKSHYKQWLLNTTGLSDDWLVRSREIVCKSVQSKKS